MSIDQNGEARLVCKSKNIDSIEFVDSCSKIISQFDSILGSRTIGNTPACCASNVTFGEEVDGVCIRINNWGSLYML